MEIVRDFLKELDRFQKLDWNSRHRHFFDMQMD